MTFWLKIEDLYVWFSEKSVPRQWKMCTFTYGHLNLKNVDLYSSFSENMDFYLKNVGLYAWFSEKMWTSTCKCGPFTHDFLKYVDLNAWFSGKKVDLNLKNVDFYASFPDESGPLP